MAKREPQQRSVFCLLCPPLVMRLDGDSVEGQKAEISGYWESSWGECPYTHCNRDQPGAHMTSVKRWSRWLAATGVPSEGHSQYILSLPRAEWDVAERET